MSVETKAATAPVITPRQSYAFMVWRNSGGHPPRFRHPTLISAVTEAERLAAERPGGTFVVLQELCRVSAPIRPAESQASGGGGDD